VPSVGFETVVPAFERLQTYALGPKATDVGWILDFFYTTSTIFKYLCNKLYILKVQNIIKFLRFSRYYITITEVMAVLLDGLA
jgi:hypothetical protein